MTPELLASLPDNALISRHEMAKLMRVTENTLQAAITSGQLPASRRNPPQRAPKNTGLFILKPSLKHFWTAKEAREIYRDYREIFRVNRKKSTQ